MDNGNSHVLEFEECRFNELYKNTHVQYLPNHKLLCICARFDNMHIFRS